MLKSKKAKTASAGVFCYASTIVVDTEQIMSVLMAEYKYWREHDEPAAMGAIANIITFCTVKDWRAEWHPKK